MRRDLRKHLLPVCLLLIASCRDPLQSPTAQSAAPLQEGSARLAGTRLLRRVYLTLLGKEPSTDEYVAMRAAASDQARDSLIQRAIDDALSSDRFEEQMVTFGRDYLQTGSYAFGTVEESSWTGGMGIEVTPCPTGTRHVGKLGIFRSPQLDLLPPDPVRVIRYAGIAITTWGH